MRYITQHSNLVLYTKGGDAKYRFGPQGVLVVGAATCTSTKIDPDATGADLMRKYDTDLLGATTISIEMVGQGSLDKKNDSGSALTNLEDGYRGFFFKAPPITSPSATDIPATAGIWYRVLTGQVCYAATWYAVGDEFESDGTNRPTTGTGTFALTIPPEITKNCDPFRDELFKVKHLKNGDEALNYWKWTDGGYEPHDSITCTDTDYYGWTR